jgi:hypothetical protein
MLKNITIIDEENLFNWKLDLDKFKIKYPTLYETRKTDLVELDYFEIIDIIPVEDDINNISIKLPSVILTFDDNTDFKIYSTELIKLFDRNYFDGYSIYSEDQFVYFIISFTDFQSGGLAIWDLDKKTWVFKYSDEGFCVEAIIYSKMYDSFIGISAFSYPYVNIGGEYFFAIKNDFTFKELELKESLNYTLNDITLDICVKYKGFDDDCLCFDQKKSVIMKKENEKFSFYNIDLDNI